MDRASRDTLQEELKIKKFHSSISFAEMNYSIPPLNLIHFSSRLDSSLFVKLHGKLLFN